jgi:hypothetical protein
MRGTENALGLKTYGGVKKKVYDTPEGSKTGNRGEENRQVGWVVLRTYRWG